MHLCEGVGTCNSKECSACLRGVLSLQHEDLSDRGMWDNRRHGIMEPWWSILNHFDKFFQVESVDFSSDSPTTTVQRPDLSEILSMLHETEQCIRMHKRICGNTIKHCISSMCLGHNSSILLLEHIGNTLDHRWHPELWSILIHGGHGCSGYANRKEDDTAIHCSGAQYLIYIYIHIRTRISICVYIKNYI